MRTRTVGAKLMNFYFLEDLLRHQPLHASPPPPSTSKSTPSRASGCVGMESTTVFIVRCHYVTVQCYYVTPIQWVLNALSFEWVCWSFDQEASRSDDGEHIARSRVRGVDGERADTVTPQWEKGTRDSGESVYRARASGSGPVTEFGPVRPSCEVGE